ncbi:MAG TPA: trehalose-phosphatase [Salinisphaeraceae bacterium]|nr:trehalose-phosphatase [Salinisphaeraceae bacterium]
MSNIPPPQAWPAPPERWALFLDFDGTLVDLAASPDAIQLPAVLPALLHRLNTHFANALAILTGRSLHSLDHYLAPPAWPAAGQHGAEIRWHAGRTDLMNTGNALAAARTRLQALAAHYPGLLLEDKGASMTLHYRAAPELQQMARSWAEALAAASAGELEVLAGKAVYELHPAGINKGHALQHFLSAPAFRDRKPLVIGDDVTDETAFVTALKSGGSAIKVGSGATAAPWRLADAAAVRLWLASLVAA